MHTLCFEVTRRCNLNCLFCGRGQSQNIDISREIIDKALDEIANNTFVVDLRISGGEPFLAQDKIVYLFDQIINRGLLVSDICIFTNGLVEPTNDFIKSIKRITEYLNNIEYTHRYVFRAISSFYSNVYSDTSPYKLVVVISDTDDRHLSSNQQCLIDKNYTTLKAIQCDDFNIVKQSINFSEDITKTPYNIEGNAEKNYKQLLDNNKSYALSDVRIIDNKYCFIKQLTGHNGEKLKNAYLFTKTLSISANGNVFPGGLTSYENVDKDPMFNVMDCKRDFFKKIISWGWCNPLSRRFNKIRQLYKSYMFLMKNHYKINSSYNMDYLSRLEVYNNVADAVEKIQKDIHPMLETLSFVEIEVLALMIYTNQMFEYGIPKQEIHQFLHDCSGLTDKQIEIIDDQFCKRFIIDYANMDKERKEQKTNERKE